MGTSRQGCQSRSPGCAQGRVDFAASAVSCVLVTAFEVDWAVLHEDVSMFVAEHLIVTLTDLRCVDAEIQDVRAFMGRLLDALRS